MILIQKVLISTYGPKTIFWLLRLNVSVLRDLPVLEISCGVFGYGLLIQIYYGDDRMNRHATYDYIREHDVKRIIGEIVPPMVKTELEKQK